MHLSQTSSEIQIGHTHVHSLIFWISAAIASKYLQHHACVFATARPSFLQILCELPVISIYARHITPSYRRGVRPSVCPSHPSSSIKTVQAGITKSSPWPTTRTRFVTKFKAAGFVSNEGVKRWLLLARL